MNAVAVSTALAGAVLAIALWLLHRRSHEARLLRERLEAASTELERLQRSFARFVPEEVVERIIARGASTGGERREVTILFADLVGFTALGESVDPAVLLRILNGYFERMNRAISTHRGYVSTFVGDGVLALFGALEPNPWQGDDAVHAALAMRAELSDYNRELSAEGLPALSLGVGLHRGVGVAGLVGSQDLMEYTVVGRTINVAARVQDLTRRQEADVLVTAQLADGLDPRFELQELEPQWLKGISEPVVVYAVRGFAAGPP